MAFWAISAVSTTQPEPPIAALVLLGLVIAAVGLIGLAVVAVRTRVRQPVAGPPCLEIPAGTEPPAVVDLLTNDFVVTDEAVPATLIDLAARRWLTIESYDVGRQLVVRLSRGDGQGPLKPYEQRVLRHVRSVAVDGVVPAGALSTGPADQSAGWWRAFRKEVVADATDRGLCQRRWPAVLPAVGGLVAMASFATNWAAGRFRDAKLVQFTPLLWASIATAGALVLVVTRIAASDRRRDTGDGRREAGRWLGLRNYLAEQGDFAQAPAASVAIWDQYLAYAAAMGLARRAVSELPLGSESDHRAWSAAGGRWRPVHVRYPHIRPGWGRHPLGAMMLGVLGGAISGAVLRYALFARTDPLRGLGALSPSQVHAVHLAATILAFVVLVPLAWSVVQILSGLVDLVAAREVDGLVLRRRLRSRATPLAPRAVRWAIDRAYATRAERSRWFVAVDDATSDVVAAWSVGAAVYDRLHQGQRVHAVVTRVLGHVRSIEIVPADGPRADVSKADGVSPDGLRSSADPALVASARRLSEARSGFSL